MLLRLSFFSIKLTAEGTPGLAGGQAHDWTLPANDQKAGCKGRPDPYRRLWSISQNNPNITPGSYVPLELHCFTKLSNTGL